MPAMSPIRAICMMSFEAGSAGRVPSSTTSLLSFGVAVSDLDGGWVGAPFAGGPAESAVCAMVGRSRVWADAVDVVALRSSSFIRVVFAGRETNRGPI